MVAYKVRLRKGSYRCVMQEMAMTPRLSSNELSKRRQLVCGGLRVKALCCYLSYGFVSPALWRYFVFFFGYQDVIRAVRDGCHHFGPHRLSSVLLIDCSSLMGSFFVLSPCLEIVAW